MQQLSEALGLFDVGEVPGAAEDLELAVRKEIMGGQGVGDRDHRVVIACGEQHRHVGQEIEAFGAVEALT